MKPFETLSPAVVRRELASVTDLAAAVRIAGQVPALAVVGKEYGRDKAELMIKAYLFDLEDYFDFDKKMNEAQLDFIASRMLDKYYGLTTADIHVIFGQLKSGVCEFYGRIHPDAVLREVDRYWEERCAAFAEQSYYASVSDKGGNITSKHAAEELARLEKKFRG